MLRCETIKPSASARSWPILRKISVVTPSRPKKIAKASNVNPIILAGSAKKLPATVPITAATKTNRIRILSPSIAVACRLMAEAPTVQRIALATNNDPARIANSFSPSPGGESVSAAPKKA